MYIRGAKHNLIWCYFKLYLNHSSWPSTAILQIQFILDFCLPWHNIINYSQHSKFLSSCDSFRLPYCQRSIQPFINTLIENNFPDTLKWGFMVGLPTKSTDKCQNSLLWQRFWKTRFGFKMLTFFRSILSIPQCQPAYVWESPLMTLLQEKVQLLSSDQRLILYMVLRRSGAMLLAAEKYFSTQSLRAVSRLGCWLGHFTQRANSLMHGYRPLTGPIQCNLNSYSFI